MDYQNGKIYVIRNHTNDLVYIGSTTQPLSKRMATHRRTSTVKLTKSRKIYQAFDKIGRDQFYIELVELYPCDLNIELLRREGHFIREYDSYNNGFNGKIECRGLKEWNEDNKDKIKEQKKIYRECNKDKIKETKKKYNEDNKQVQREQKKNLL
jgi:hypothetical protein